MTGVQTCALPICDNHPAAGGIRPSRPNPRSPVTLGLTRVEIKQPRPGRGSCNLSKRIAGTTIGPLTRSILGSCGYRDEYGFCDLRVQEFPKRKRKLMHRGGSSGDPLKADRATASSRESVNAPTYSDRMAASARWRTMAVEPCRDQPSGICRHGRGGDLGVCGHLCRTPAPKLESGRNSSKSDGATFRVCPRAHQPSLTLANERELRLASHGTE